jgi:hypothetical protein
MTALTSVPGVTTGVPAETAMFKVVVSKIRFTRQNEMNLTDNFIENLPGNESFNIYMQKYQSSG